jgi:ferredoxin
MARIEVDLALCQGYANCVVTAPDIFDLSADGKADVLLAEVTGGQLPLAEEAARSCPAAALRLAAS